MGVINITPDSFYDGSRKMDIKGILDVAAKMLSEGATFLDIGGYSSRPGADDISEKDEVDRILTPIRSLRKEFPEAVLSIDTFRRSVAEAAIDEGADMVNDISGGHLDTEMLTMIGQHKVPYVAMHMKGTPQTMATNNTYEDLLFEMGTYFSRIIDNLTSHGVKDIILDPGFGFAKNMDQNFMLLENLDYLKQFDYPILVGLSRKSMIYKTLKTDPGNALNGTSVLNTIALLKGANILRVHDVKYAIEVIELINKLAGDSGN